MHTPVHARRSVADKVAEGHRDGCLSTSHRRTVVLRIALARAVRLEPNNKYASTMGSNQSRPSDAAVQEKLIERLQALQVKDDRSMNEKDGYIYVDSEARMLHSFCRSKTML